MKLLDVLKENALQAFATNKNINVFVGPDTNDTDLVKAIQKELSKHSIAKGERPEGQWWPNDTKGWTGPINGVWDNRMTQAVVEWERSINIQLADMKGSQRPLNANGMISQQDAKYLLAPVNNLGWLKNRELESAISKLKNIIKKFPPRNGQQIANFDIYKINTFSDMIKSIGYDGWMAILVPIARVRFGDGQIPRDTLVNWANDSVAKILNNSRNNDLLNDNWRAIMLPSNNGRIKAGNLFGGETFIIPDFERLRKIKETYLGPGLEKTELFDRPKLLFLHYASIAQFYIESNKVALNKQAKETEEENAKSKQNDVANIDQLTARQLAEQINNAMENNYWAIFTSKRVESDEMSIEEAMTELHNAKDYDAVAVEFKDLTGEDLSIKMRAELDDDLYKSIFVGHLVRIRRINPRLYHNAIQFGGADSVTVNYADQEFKILAAFNDNNGRPNIEPEVKDVILEDALLKEAINNTGGQLPDLYRQPSAAETTQAVDTFINVMNETYPEMTAFYAHLPPFTDYPPFGKLRLKGIIEEVTVYTAAGSDPTQFIINSIEKDRIWLVGDGSDNDGDGEPDPGNANIYFDSKYASEGLNGRDFEIGEQEEKIDLTDQELDIIRDLASGKEDIVLGAIDRLFALNNPAKQYIDRIYPGYKQETGQFIEFDLGGRGDDAWTHKFFSKEETSSNKYMEKLLTEMANSKNTAPLQVIAFIAPKGVADEFKLALNRPRFFGTFNDVDDEHLMRLVKAVMNREDFNLVDKYYDGDLQQEIEDKDWWGENPETTELLNKIGVNPKELKAEENFTLLKSETEEVIGQLNALPTKAEDRTQALEEIDFLSVIERIEKYVDEIQDNSSKDGYGEQDMLKDLLDEIAPYFVQSNFSMQYRDIPNWQEASERLKKIYERLGGD